MTLSSSSPSCHWPSLPVEIQLAITQHLDVRTLHSLSLVSRYNHALCLPAIYNVRWLVQSPEPPSPSSLDHADLSSSVGNNIVVHKAPTLCGSRTSRPCATHSLTGHQHRRQDRHHTGGVLRCTCSNPFSHPPSSNALSPPFRRVVPTSDIILFQARAADRSRHRALPRCVIVSCLRASCRSASILNHESGASGPS
jgi:hypothetical protein